MVSRLKETAMELKPKMRSGLRPMRSITSPCGVEPEEERKEKPQETLLFNMHIPLEEMTNDQPISIQQR